MSANKTIVDCIIEAFNEKELPVSYVARKSKLSYLTVQNVIKGKTKNPNAHTVCGLMYALDIKPAKLKECYGRKKIK